MCEAGLVVADVTDRNPNVMYELGLIDAVGQDVILIGQSIRPDDLPFDILGDRVIQYSVENLADLTRELSGRLSALRSAWAGSSDRRG